MNPTFEPEKYEFLKNRVRVDLMAIDEELMEMPTLLQEAGELTAQAYAISNDCKDKIDEILSITADRLRRIPTESGKSRSEAMIGSEVFAERDVVGARMAYNNAKLDAGLWQSVQEALRKKADLIYTATELIKVGFISKDHILAERRAAIRGNR